MRAMVEVLSDSRRGPRATTEAIRLSLRPGASPAPPFGSAVADSAPAGPTVGRREGYVERSPAEGLAPKVRSPRDERDAFTDADLTAIFSADFAELRADERIASRKGGRRGRSIGPPTPRRSAALGRQFRRPSLGRLRNIAPGASA